MIVISLPLPPLPPRPPLSLAFQVQRIMTAAGGEGTVDEVVEELLLEERWTAVGAPNLRKKVASLMGACRAGGGAGGAGSEGRGGEFESTRAWRSSEHKRTVYQMR